MCNFIKKFFFLNLYMNVWDILMLIKFYICVLFKKIKDNIVKIVDVGMLKLKN